MKRHDKMNAEKMIAEMIEAGIVWSGDRDTAVAKLNAGERWGTGIKDEKEEWEKAEEIAESHGFAADVDDSDGIPYLSLSRS